MSAPEEPFRNPAAWREELHTRGLKATASRLAVLSLLEGSQQPLSHGEVVAQLGDIYFEKTTIFRNLVDLCDVGLLRRLDLGDRTWRFELADHCSVGHAHLVCSNCGRVTCLGELSIKDIVSKLPLANCSATISDVIVKGRCGQCFATDSAGAPELQ